MRIVFHAEMLDGQQFSCNCCSRCCRSFLVPVNSDERQKIEARADWRKEFEVAELYIVSDFGSSEPPEQQTVGHVQSRAQGAYPAAEEPAQEYGKDYYDSGKEQGDCQTARRQHSRHRRQ